MEHLKYLGVGGLIVIVGSLLVASGAFVIENYPEVVMPIALIIFFVTISYFIGRSLCS